MLKNFNITAILVCLMSMCSINHATAAENMAEFCLLPYNGVTHDECLTAINKGVRLYQNCSRDSGCWGAEYDMGLRTKSDNSIRFLYDGKWYNIRLDYVSAKNDWTMQCYASYLTPCTD
tara:strand:- start:4316 stop:4672 length:357 start_codon:yes stop_codon:yes gene_type:complete